MDKLIFVIVVAVVIVAIGPLLTIWSLNTLFPVLAIPYSFDTWCAVVLLGLFIRAKVDRS
mgnify:CR=1 FL=1